MKSTFARNTISAVKFTMAAALTIGAMSTFAASASADACTGLDCPEAGLQTVAAHGSLPALSPAELDATKASGFYDVGTRGDAGEREVAYVSGPGQWSSAPVEIRRKFSGSLSKNDRAYRKVVIFDEGAMLVEDTAASPLATSSSVIVPMSYSDCSSGYFCVFDGGSGSGDRYQWASTGVWQGLGSAVNRASSMRNRRTGWSLLKRSSDGRNYCAQPISQDDSLSNNGFNNNTSTTYNSTSETKSSGWNCAN